MGQPLSGVGVLLPPPQNYYPSELNNAPQDPSSNVMSLAGGDVFNIPAGRFYIDLSGPLVLQYQDPVNSIWVTPIAGALDRIKPVESDGQTYRIANLTGCAVAAVVTDAGSGYVQSTTTVAASAGGSTWQPIVGGQVSVTSISVAGANYGVAPLLMIPPPPSPGIQAAGHTVISNGSVSSVVLDEVGAGYNLAPTAVIVPSPFDPNINSGITQASVVLGLTASGTITGIVCTNHGAPVSSAPSLTIAGVGSGATATAILCQTLIGASVATAGTGWTGGAALETVGGVPSATPVNTVPLAEGRRFIPRPAQALLAASSGSLTSVSAIYDGGLFFGTPEVILTPLGGVLQTASASVTASLGSAVGVYRLQNAP